MFANVVYRVGIALVLACAAVNSGGLRAFAQGGDVPVAFVNGTPIPRKAVEQIVSGIAAVKGEAERGTQEVHWQRSALESLIEFELLYQEAKRAGVEVDPKEVEKELDRTKSKFGGESGWRQALAERGWPLEELKRDTERALVVQRFLESVVWKNVRVEPSAVDEFYRKNQAEFRHPRQVRLRHALVPVRTPTEQAWLAAEQTAQAIRRKWLAVSKDSRGAGAATNALEEDLGWVGPGELDPEVEAWALGAATGAVSPVLRRTDGVHLFLVVARREAGVIPLEEARPKIEAVLRKRERQRLRDELVARLREQAEIHYP